MTAATKARTHPSFCLDFGWAEFGVTAAREIRIKALEALRRFEATPLAVLLLANPSGVLEVLKDRHLVRLLPSSLMWPKRLETLLTSAGVENSDPTNWTSQMHAVSLAIEVARAWAKTGRLTDGTDAQQRQLLRYAVTVCGSVGLLDRRYGTDHADKIIADKVQDIEEALELGLDPRGVAKILHWASAKR